MDENVIAAMARWPNVPDVFGWLSLNPLGQWRLHPDGDASLPDCPSGQPISSPQINRFINHNYGHDAQGRWFFQNGPQRVYVRLDAAPYVLHTIQHDAKEPAFSTHNGRTTRQLAKWCLDDTGRLYALTDIGAGLIAGRDLERVLDQLTTVDGASLLEVLDPGLGDPCAAPDQLCWNGGYARDFLQCGADEVPDILGFVRCPQPMS